MGKKPANSFSCVSCIALFCYYLEQQVTAALKGPRISWTGLQDLKDLQDYVEWKFSLKRKYGRLVSATAKRVASPPKTKPSMLSIRWAVYDHDTAQTSINALGREMKYAGQVLFALWGHPPERRCGCKLLVVSYLRLSAGNA